MKQKIVIAFAAVMMLVGFASAQETSSSKFEVGANVGVTTFYNNPALSLFTDNTEQYVTNTQSLYAGYRLGNTLVGLQFSNMASGLNLASYNSLLNESIRLSTLSLMGRHYGRLGEHFEPFCGIRIGMAIANNTWTNYLALDEAQRVNDVSRKGLVCDLELGLNYKVSARTFFGISGSLSTVANLDNSFEQPEGFVEHSKNLCTSFGYYNVMFSYGIRF